MTCRSPRLAGQIVTFNLVAFLACQPFPEWSHWRLRAGYHLDIGIALPTSGAPFAVNGIVCGVGGSCKPLSTTASDRESVPAAGAVRRKNATRTHLQGPEKWPQPQSGGSPMRPVDEPVPGDAAGLAQVVADYAARFERDYSAVLAEERYVQIIHPWRGLPKGPESEPSLTWVDSGAPLKGRPVVMRRQLLSDMLLVQVAGRDWMAYRDVVAVDSRPVRQREERMRHLLLSPAADAAMQLRRIGDESARFNLGAVRRTMNLPNVTLSFLRSETQARFMFESKRDEQLDGRPMRVLAYRERPGSGTLIRTPEGRSVPVYGRLWVGAKDGLVWRTELRLERGEMRSIVRVDFAKVLAGAVLLPTVMWEWYEGVDVLGGITEERSTAQGLATYSAYRSFSVTTSESVKP